jgi:hypothetical protein
MPNSQFWDKEELILTVPKNARGEEIRVKKAEKKGKQYVDIRTYFPNPAGEMCPCSKGIAIPIESVGNIADTLMKLCS